MPALGLLVMWAGYTGVIYGLTFIRGKNLTLSDLVLPTHLAAYQSAWSSASSIPGTINQVQTTQGPPTPTSVQAQGAAGQSAIGSVNQLFGSK